MVGNLAELGNWDPARAVGLSAGTYPTWSGTVDLPPSTAVEYKYIKKDDAGNVTWEGGENRTFTTPDSGTVTRDDTWR